MRFSHGTASLVGFQASDDLGPYQRQQSRQPAENLRYLCPNCDSQLSTRGGANRGRVREAVEGRFVLIQRDGKLHTHVLVEPIGIQLKAAPAKLIISKKH
jgi:hypothetical protein